MTPPPTIPEARCDVWTCGPGIGDLPLDEVEYILAHPNMDGYRGEPARIVSMARFMVTMANDFLMCYLTGLGCLDLAVRVDPAAAHAVTYCIATISPCKWGPTRFVIEGCIQNLPGDRERLSAAVRRGVVPRTDLAEFDVWHKRAKAAYVTSDYVQERMSRAQQGYTDGVGFDPEALDRLTVGRIIATMQNIDLDQQRCFERMEEAFRKSHERMETQQHQCAVM